MEFERFYADLGLRLRETRKKAGLTQAELAERVGMTRTALVTIERGNQRMAVHQLVALAAAVGVEPAMLLPKHGDLAERVEHAVQEAGLPPDIAAWASQAVEQLGQGGDGGDKTG